MRKTALVIINQHTAKQKLKNELLNVLDVLTKGGYDCLVRPTQRAGDAKSYVEKNASPYDLLVCVGGDGTLNEVVTGLCNVPAENRPAVGYIPAGTTNDFAASIGLPTEPVAAARMILESAPRKMDCGRVGESIFCYIASFGAFTDVSYETPQPLKNTFGHFAYILEGASRLGDIRPVRMRFTSENGTIEDDFIFGAFANTLSIGGVIHLSPEMVDLSDGKHEYLLVKMPKNPVELHEAAQELRRLQTHTSDARGMKYVYFGSFSKGEIETGGNDIAWSIDGERLLTGGRVSIENLHAAYSLCAG